MSQFRSFVAVFKGRTMEFVRDKGAFFWNLVFPLLLIVSCLFGIGFIIIRYRKNGVLKRMKATPVTALSFLSGHVVSRFFIVMVTSSILFWGTNIFFNYVMEGSWLNLLIIWLLGILSLTVFGVLFAVRIKNEELGGNLIQITLWPMLLLSGVFFNLEAAPPLIQNLSRIIPLSHFIAGARAVMLNGANLVQILPNIVYLSIFTVVTLILASLLFRWE